MRHKGIRLTIKWVNGWAQAAGTGPDGCRVRRALGTQDRRQAEVLRANLERQLFEASVLGVKEVLTFEQAAIAYIENGGDKRFILKMAEELQGMRLRDITPHAVRVAAKSAYPAGSPATRNRQGITPVRAVINYAHEQGWCGAIRVKGFTVEKPSRKSVDRDYLDTLRPHLPPNLFALLLFLFTTGRRVGDAIHMRPEWINGSVVEIPKTKNGDAATAHLTPEVALIIAGLDPVNGRVFGYKDRRSIYGTLRRACKAAGVEYLGTHQLGRHSFNTHLHEAGFSIPDIAKASGAKDHRLLMATYIHPGDKSAEVVKLFSKKAQTI